ncbi:hypothetical protein BDV19DRAFT_400322 [Aspergillus venezuelensis]
MAVNFTAFTPAGPLSVVDSEAVDIPFQSQGNPYALVSEKAGQIIDAETKKLDHLTSKFTKGFDPGAFGETIMASLPMLAGDLFPGSYAHLLLLLFESSDVIEDIQINLERWTGNYDHGTPIIQPSKTSSSDETFFVNEINMLRRLLSPIRRGTKKEIFWLNTRRADPGKTCEQLEASIRAIEMFKSDICAAMKPGHEQRTIYNQTSDNNEWSKLFSLKQSRLDTCKATLQWDSFSGSEIELSSFFRSYKTHISEYEPARARASGWLPPKSPGTPRLSSPKASSSDLASWASHGVNEEFLDLLLQTALWLSLARGFAAVLLFCDVARLFVLQQPSTSNSDYWCFLLHLISYRATPGGTRLSPSHMTPREDNVFPTRNTDYFQDIMRTGHKLSENLYDDTSLLERRMETGLKLSNPPVRRRSVHGESITQSTISGSPGINDSSSDDGSPSNATTDDDDLPDFSPQTSFSQSRAI